MASTYLTRSVSSTGDRRKWTWSGWLKRANLGSNYIMASNNDSNQYAMLQFDATDVLRYYDYTNTYITHLKTNRKFRDSNAWYHIVVTYDSAQGTAADRVKFYVNGVQETSFGTSTYPSQNYDSFMNLSGVPHYIGRESGTSYLYNGLMSHVHLCDGYAYAASDFGQTDSTTGEWTIKTSPSVSYGTNGYFIFKDNASVTDQSGQGNNFTVTAGTLTFTHDNPSNNFATINNVLGNDVVGSTVVFNSGNTDVKDPNGSASGINPNFISTLGMPSKGKWYCELRPLAFSTSSGHSIGIYRTKGSTDDTGEGELELNASKIRYIYADTSIYIIKYGTNDQTGLTSISANETVGMALDLDNGTLQYYVNGSARANQITGINSANDGYDYFFHAGLESSSSGRYGRYYWNFGNGYFSTTAITSNSGNGYQDSNGQGKFEYQPPTNFLALCTKNLNI